jgi:hypothetical protein
VTSESRGKIRECDFLKLIEEGVSRKREEWTLTSIFRHQVRWD